jgi:EAL domain-containing protein (putative c-di-GMP-specific phosphodiesterase class I)
VCATDQGLKFFDHPPEAPGMSLTNELEQTRRTRDLIEELLTDTTLLGPDFQPIHRLTDGALVGYKATGRGQSGTEIAHRLDLLASARSLGLVERLDWAFRCLAFDVALDCGMAGELHLTPEPETFGSPCPPRLAVSFGRGRRSLTVAAELHEDAFADLSRLRSAVEEMRAWGWKLVVCETAAGVGGAVDSLTWLRPEYVRVDLGATELAGSSAVRDLVDAARAQGAAVMAIGVDTPRARSEAEGLQADYARGALLGEPGDLPLA